MTTRRRIRVRGIVQGVGFRPFVYRIACESGLSGWVLNDDQGVLLEAEGDDDAVRRFEARLRDEPPPLAVIDALDVQTIATVGSHGSAGGRQSIGGGPVGGHGSIGGHGFEIRASVRSGHADAVIAPDTATCPDCLAELLDPADRRYRYPFVNCTNCGPRLTIVESVPYDRARTTMSRFAMCPECTAEYEDPSNRRFHAQPNACPVCGPSARLVSASGAELDDGSGEAIAHTALLLAAGRIVAIKGLGGYHLACDARNPHAVDALRARKRRARKPFALMVADLDAARRVLSLASGYGSEVERLLTAPERPITLVMTSAAGRLADGIAPGLRELGIMLPYTPLHHLLLHDLTGLASEPPVLVMTSANASDEPIAYEDADALERLGGIADAFLIHDRPIRTRVDDSVVRPLPISSHRPRTDDQAGVHDPVLPGARQTFRRSRGYAPAPLTLPFAPPAAVLATGADLKNTFALARGRRVWISHHIGDLENYASLLSYQDGIAQFERLFEVTPEVIVHDLHPGYASTRYALERSECEGLPVVGVQHHHAHLAACLAEHRLGPDTEVVAAVYDGTGYGTDGTVWGGEILIGNMARFDRFCSLLPVRMPGGTAAIREPWRMAVAWLQAADATVPNTVAAGIGAGKLNTIVQVAGDPALSPLTTSMGRLLDAVAAICGIGQRISYEGEAAIEFEACGEAAESRVPAQRYELPLVAAGTEHPRSTSCPQWLLDPRPLLAAVARDVRRTAGAPDAGAIGAIARGVHAAVADATAQACRQAARARGLDTVVLAGGVFLNRTLLRGTATALSDEGLRVLTPQLLPPGDGGICLGQVAIAAARSEARRG